MGDIPGPQKLTVKGDKKRPSIPKLGYKEGRKIQRLPGGDAIKRKDFNGRLSREIIWFVIYEKTPFEFQLPI